MYQPPRQDRQEGGSTSLFDSRSCPNIGVVAPPRESNSISMSGAARAPDATRKHQLPALGADSGFPDARQCQTPV